MGEMVSPPELLESCGGGLLSLMAEYSFHRSNILMTSLLSFVTHAYNIVSQEEYHKSLSCTYDKSVVVFNAKKPLLKM